MTPERLQERLNQLDRGIARAYESQSRNNWPINQDDAARIFAHAMDGEMITPDEAESLRLILDHARFADGVRDYLKSRIRRPETFRALYNGSRDWLEGQELAEFYRALALPVVGNISFHSFGTGIRYCPAEYQGICRLVADDKIFVFELDDRGLGEYRSKRGQYNQYIDRIIIHRSERWDKKAGTIVHEATHAIQDWQNINSFVQYAEADAFIAQAVAYRALGLGVGSEIAPLRVAYLSAWPIVSKRQAVPNNDSWFDAYHKVVRAVVQLPGYKGRRNKRYQNSKDVRNNEPDLLRRESQNALRNNNR